MTSNNWEDAYTFVQLDTDGNMTTKQVKGGWITLEDMATAFADFLRGSGYPYVESVEIHTEKGSSFASE